MKGGVPNEKLKLKDFMSYINRVLHFNELVNRFAEKRQRKSIPLSTIVKMTILGLVFQFPSLNQIFNHRYSGDRMWKNAFRGKLPRTDAARNVIKSLSPSTCKYIHNCIVHKLKENKNLRQNKIDHFAVVAIDGVELFTSNKESKKNKNSLTRKHSNGETEYFSRSVVCMTVGDSPHIVLGQTMLSARDGAEKDEGENTGAKRLVEELYKEFHHFADIIVGDALYLNAPFINTALSKHIDVVIRAKDENRCIVKDALGIIEGHLVKAQKFYTGKNNKVEITAYEICNMEMDGVRDKLRFVQFENPKAKEKENKKIWIVTSSEAGIETLWKIIHSRWHIENNGFHQLKTYYHADHCFVKDAIDIMFMLNIIAFNMREAYLFYHMTNFRALKITRIEVTEIFKQDLLLDSMQKWFEGG